MPELKFDYKFFIGDASKACAEDDVVVLDCGDDYNSLPEKTLSIIRWTRGYDYDRLLKLDDDVYVRPERLVVPNADYVGHAYGSKYSSGAAYWLSANAMDTILAKWYRRSNHEDRCIGETLKFHRIHLTEDGRYKVGWQSLPTDVRENEFPHPSNDTITFHMLFPGAMPEMHASWDKKKQFVDETFRNRY